MLRQEKVKLMVIMVRTKRSHCSRKALQELKAENDDGDALYELAALDSE